MSDPTQYSSFYNCSNIGVPNSASDPTIANPLLSYSMLFWCVNPAYWGYLGVAFSIALSVVGAAW